jgi:hypothetical protein
MVQCLTSTFGRSHGDVQVALDFILSHELIKAAGSEAGVKRNILDAGLA